MAGVNVCRASIGIALSDDLRAEVFDEEAEKCLSSIGRVEDVGDPTLFGNALPDVDVLITGWRMPRLEPALLETAPRLRLIAHIGAAITPFVTHAVFERGIVVTQAGQGMARSVAETALTMTLGLLHQVHRADHAMRAEAAWPLAGALPARHEILGSVIGVVGASRTGRAYIPLVQSLGARVLLADPYVVPSEAEDLGVELVSLKELLSRSRIVCVHAPALPETHHMIGTAELAALATGSGLVNTARSWLVDQAALLAELLSGRIDGAFDVFDVEPLPADHPFRTLANVLLTPHQAAASVEGRRRQGAILVEEVRRFLDGSPLVHRIRAGDPAAPA